MRRMTWLLAAVLWPATACHDEDKGMVRFCTLPEECGCSQYQGVDDCLNSILQNEDFLRQEAEQAGAQFAPDCLRAHYEATVDTLACKPNSETLGLLEHVLRCDVCEIIYDDKQEGATCRLFGQGSDCAPGLDCVAGTCVDLCTERALGEACTFTAESDLTYTYPCKGGVCDAMTGLCSAGLADGAACTSPSQCLSGSCNPSGVCGLPKLGDACVVHSDCGPWKICSEGACASLPGEGEACMDGGCAQGYQCDPTSGSLCVAEKPWVCPAG